MTAPQHRRGHRLLAVVAVATLALTSACTTGGWVPESPSAAGVQQQSGVVKARNILLVADESGDGALVGYLSASEAVELTGATVAGIDAEGNPGEPVPVEVSGSVPRSGALQLDGSNATVSGANLIPGLLADVELAFDDGTRIRLQAPVMSAEHEDYSTVLEG